MLEMGTALRRPLVRLCRDVPLLPRRKRTRPTGEPCRHPDKVRPSLEACGFDIGRTTTELFGMDLKWGTDGRIPEYLLLVCGFFHNAESVVWDK